jgi:hypothetical protein
VAAAVLAKVLVAAALVFAPFFAVAITVSSKALQWREELSCSCERRRSAAPGPA